MISLGITSFNYSDVHNEFYLISFLILNINLRKQQIELQKLKFYINNTEMHKRFQIIYFRLYFIKINNTLS